MKRFISPSLLALLFGLTQASLLCEPAHAVLGGDEGAIENDRRAVSGVMHAATGHGSYTVYEFVASGRTIREYATLDGKIFGVAWQGTSAPDLALLLGSYYEEFSQGSRASNTASRRSARRSHGIVQGPNAVVERSGHMRDLRGRAYVDALRPEKVSIDEIR